MAVTVESITPHASVFKPIGSKLLNPDSQIGVDEEKGGPWTVVIFVFFRFCKLSLSDFDGWIISSPNALTFDLYAMMPDTSSTPLHYYPPQKS